MKIAIIGGGVAAFEAACAARALDQTSEIVLYSREAVPPYRRPALSGMIAEPMADAQFFIKPPAFYEEKRILLKLGTGVRSIDPAAGKLLLDDGEEAAYDRLLLATGSHCFLPPVPGIDGKNVLSLREFRDLEEIRRRIEGGARNVVVIGGGLLGLELAASILARGCTVTVIEGCPALLPRNLDAEAAELVRSRLAAIPGLTLRFGTCVKAITSAGVELNGNETLPADLVLVSAGTRANLEPAASAGLKCNRGIVTDDAMRTGTPGIFAAGDCAEVNGVCYGLYTAARAMGQTAGTNIAGGNAVFKPEAYPARLAVFGLKIFSAGRLEGNSSKVERDDAKGTFQKLFHDAAGKLVGCILIGDLRAAMKLQAEIDQGL